MFDGFCGTGMTGVAAQLCSDQRTCLELNVNDAKSVGLRHAIISDLSPEAAFIAHSYNTHVDIRKFREAALRIIEECKKECGWVYETNAVGSLVPGNINYTIWSEVYACPQCSREIVYWDVAVDDEHEKSIKKPVCKYCGASLKKSDCEKIMIPTLDERTNEVTMQPKSVPIRINYECGGKRYTKKPDEDDLRIIQKIEEMSIGYWYPTDLMMNIGSAWGDQWRAGYHVGMTRVNHFYFKRNLYVLAKCFNCIEKEEDSEIRSLLKFWMSSIYSRSHKLNRYMPDHHRHVGPLSGTLYIPAFQAEINIISLLKDKLDAILNVSIIPDNSCVSVQSATDLRNIEDQSVDYIFVDPPFGDNLQYSELNFIQESWLKCETNNKQEAIINNSQGKGVPEYQYLMEKSFKEFYRILKPNRWITVEFHNSKNAVWNSLQEALQKAGFIIADVRTLDKQKGTTKQLSYNMTVKQDLVISAYRPKEQVVASTLSLVGTEASAWEFVREHLENLPVVVLNNGKIVPVVERQAFLLFDRMVAYHIMRGLPIPIDTTDFYRGLDEKYLKRDGMYFLPNQVNEYDTARIINDVEPIQLGFIVSNEKTAISWLYQLLDKPQTYAEIQPRFMQEVKSVDKYEAMPELSVLLEENFLQDDKGRWYIPDVTKEADVAKLREKNLLKEFEGYLTTKGKLKLFRAEAIRVGFAKLWKDKNYKLIVETAERLPEQVVQEDDKLLMYYDISLSRV